MAVLLLLVDGLGLGDPDADRNPLAVARTRWFRCFRAQIPATDGCSLVSTDASLGVPGLPQSATGQTALLTGLNAPLLVGRHIQGFCTPTLASMLTRHSLFRTFSRRGGRIAWANAFTEPTLRRRRFFSVATVAARTAGVRLRDLSDLGRGQALHHDFTNRLLRTRGYPVPLLSPEDAAERLITIAETADLTYYEYVEMDLAGHAQDMDRAVKLLAEFDRFLSSLVERLDRSRHLLVLVSDHGNVEDLSSPSHTWNRVPTMIWGRGKEILARRTQALTDIAPALLAVWQAARQQSAVSRQQSALSNEDLVPFADR
jgi:hypothetical protein